MDKTSGLVLLHFLGNVILRTGYQAFHLWVLFKSELDFELQYSFWICCGVFFNIILFIYGCAGSSLVHEGFLYLWRVGLLLRALELADFSSCGTQA